LLKFTEIACIECFSWVVILHPVFFVHQNLKNLKNYKLFKNLGFSSPDTTQWCYYDRVVDLHWRDINSQ